MTRPRQINFQARKNLFDVLILCEFVVCEKKIKKRFSLHLGSMLFPKFLKCWKLMHIKKFSFEHYREIKISRIIVFLSDHEIKMLQNVVFRLNHEMEMRRNSKIDKKTRKVKMPQKFHAGKVSCLKVTSTAVGREKTIKTGEIRKYHLFSRLHFACLIRYCLSC